METDAESFCCAEADEIPEEMFQSKSTLFVILMFNHSLGCVYPTLYTSLDI